MFVLLDHDRSRSSSWFVTAERCSVAQTYGTALHPRKLDCFL
jgi:hypothetical protein